MQSEEELSFDWGQSPAEFGLETYAFIGYVDCRPCDSAMTFYQVMRLLGIFESIHDLGASVFIRHLAGFARSLGASSIGPVQAVLAGLSDAADWNRSFLCWENLIIQPIILSWQAAGFELKGAICPIFIQGKQSNSSGQVGSSL